MSQLRDVLERAERDHIAVGHFNISDLAVLNGIVAAARELGVPVLVGVSEGERAFMGVRQVAAVVKSLHEETDCPIFSERADAAPSRRSGQRKTIRRSPRLDRARPDPAGAATHQRAPRKTHSVPPHTSAPTAAAASCDPGGWGRARAARSGTNRRPTRIRWQNCWRGKRKRDSPVRKPVPRARLPQVVASADAEELGD